MPTFMPSRSDVSQGLGVPRGKGRPKRNPLKGLTMGTPAPAAGMPPARPPMRMAKGGSASSRADGIAKQGKTKGKLL
jgi:hypothetical protein